MNYLQALQGELKRTIEQIAAELGIDPAERSRLLAAFMSRYHHATQLTRLFDGVADALSVKYTGDPFPWRSPPGALLVGRRVTVSLVLRNCT